MLPIMSKALIFLHTSPVHLPTFGALAAEIAPDLALRQVVAEDLLAEARAAGLTDALAGRVAAALRAALGADGGAILCTCSTIGALAEAAGASLGTPVLRVDRAMAARAVEVAPPARHSYGTLTKDEGQRTKDQPASLVLRPSPPSATDVETAGWVCTRIALIAALESTLGPTRRLLEEEAARAGRAVIIAERLCAGAWPRFEAGDMAGYLAEVAACARASAADADVIVLAQASMAGAADMLADLGSPVLSSPRLGVAAAAALCRAGAPRAKNP